MGLEQVDKVGVEVFLGELLGAAVEVAGETTNCAGIAVDGLIGLALQLQGGEVFLI